MTTQSRRSAVWLARAVTYFVYAYVVVVEIILGMGFFLLLFGANPSASFVPTLPWSESVSPSGAPSVSAPVKPPESSPQNRA